MLDMDRKQQEAEAELDKIKAVHNAKEQEAKAEYNVKEQVAKAEYDAKVQEAEAEFDKVKAVYNAQEQKTQASTMPRCRKLPEKLATKIMVGRLTMCTALPHNGALSVLSESRSFWFALSRGVQAETAATNELLLHGLASASEDTDAKLPPSKRSKVD